MPPTKSPLRVTVGPVRRLGAEAPAIPGDKSISHRAVLLAAVGDGEVEITGFGRSGDTESTLRAVRALGAEVEEPDIDVVRVRGRGLRGLSSPDGPIDAGNAGTLMRLLAGLLAGQEGRFELVGDESLSARPMERVAAPLRELGAHVETTDGHAPLVVEGGKLRGITYELPVASAQVKSAVLLAGLYAKGRTTVVEPAATRDHTELLLQHAGVEVERKGLSVSVTGVERLDLGRVDSDSSPTSSKRPSCPASSPASSRISVPALPASIGPSVDVSPRSPRPRTRTTSMSGSSTSAPSARTACSVDSVSPERPKPLISTSPSATAARSTARCEIDLSPGTTACPTSARAGSIFTRRPPARRRPRSPAPRATRPRGVRAPRP